MAPSAGCKSTTPSSRSPPAEARVLSDDLHLLFDFRHSGSLLPSRAFELFGRLLTAINCPSFLFRLVDVLVSGFFSCVRFGATARVVLGLLVAIRSSKERLRLNPTLVPFAEELESSSVSCRADSVCCDSERGHVCRRRADVPLSG